LGHLHFFLLAFLGIVVLATSARGKMLRGLVAGVGVSIRYSKRPAKAGIEPSLGSKGTATTTPWQRLSMASIKPS